MLLHKFDIYSDYSLKVDNRPPLWRVKHDIELPRGIWRPGLPEVFPLFPNHFSDFTAEWQLESKTINPLFSKEKWTVIYGPGLWIANGQGFGMATPRANYVTGENTTDGSALPKVEALTCGGNLLTGYTEGLNLIVEMLDWHDSPIYPDELLKLPWHLTYAVSNDGNGTPRRFAQGLQPDGNVVPFLHPQIGDPTKYPKITFPLELLEKWDRPYLPDPYAIYL